VPQSERRNLVLLTIDAWRADFVATFDGIALLPALDAVARHSVRFENYHANAPWTTPALVSMLTGESPARHGVFYQWSNPRPDSPGMAKRLGAAGYALPNVCYLNSIDGYHNLGFGPCPLSDVGHAAGDTTLVAALREQRRRDEPFFLWHHHTSLHFPYWPGEAYRRRLGLDDAAIPQRLRETICREWNIPRDKFSFPAGDRDIVRRLYAAELLEFNDEFLRPLLEELQKDGLMERTTLVLAADHGDEHLEHGHVGHASTAEHATLYEEVLRTPLIVVDSRIDGLRPIAARIQGIDLFPTLLSLVGVPTPAGPGAFDFSSAILDPAAALPAPGRVFYFHSARMGFRTPREREGQIIEGISDGRMKFIAERYDATRFLRYDLTRDPAEQAAAVFAADEESPDFLAAVAQLAEMKAMLLGN
jgi:choline-sulfatase